MTGHPAELDRFGHDEAWHLGSALVDRCRDEHLPVTIAIRIGQQRVFHVALAGTSADNDGWVDRKANVVARFGCASADVHGRHVGDDPDRFFAAFGLSPVDYAPWGGAVPVMVRGSVVGVLAVSGLESAKDHDLALAALRAEAERQRATA